MHRCPKCGYERTPPEPPLGSTVRDRNGATMKRIIDVDGRDGWAPGEGFYALGKWEAVWERRGPLEEVL